MKDGLAVGSCIFLSRLIFAFACGVLEGLRIRIYIYGEAVNG